MNLLFILKMSGFALLVVTILFAFSLFNLWSQLARYKNYWERNNEKSAMPGEILYVALGDSTAQGIGASHPEKGYAGIIREKIAERSGKPVRLINLSKSGAKTKDVLTTQLPTMQKLGINEKTIITVEIGANEMSDFDPVTFESDMNELMSKLPSQAVISDIPYFGGSRLSSKEPAVEAANKIMYKLADKHGYTLAPLHARMQRNSGIRTFAVDWFHPSNYAYRENWAPVFLERLQDN